MEYARIIVVTANDGCRKQFETLWGESQAEQALFESGAEAAAWLDSFRRGALRGARIPFDALITDLRLPDMEGPELAALYRRYALFNNLPVLYLIEPTDLSGMTDLLAEDAADCLCLPVHPGELRLRLKNMLRLKTETKNRFEQERKNALLNNTSLMAAALVRNSIIGTLVLDGQRTIAWANRSFEIMTGLELDTIAGCALDQLPFADVFPSQQTAFWENLNPHFPWRHDASFLRTDGTVVIAELSAIAIFRDENIISNYIITLNDVTDRENKRLKMTRDLELARQLQIHSLSEPLLISGLSIEGRYVPSEVLGGDLYCWLPLDDNRVLVFLLDVVGHGVSSALVSIFLRALLPAYAVKYQNPSEIVRHLDHLTARLNQLYQYDIYIYFTSIVVLIDLETAQMEIVNAGHPPAVIMDRSGEFTVIPAGCPPVGMIGHRDIAEQKIDIEDRQSVYLFSDGFCELFGFDPGQEFIAKIEQDLIGMRGSGKNLLAVLEETVLQSEPVKDDVSLVMIDFEA